MEKFEKFLTKKEEDKLTPEEKKEYRAWKKKLKTTKEKDDFLDQLVSLAQEIRSQRYTYYKINPDTKQGLEKQMEVWHDIRNSGTPEKIINLLKSVDYLKYRDIINDILVEGLKFPILLVRKESNKFYDKLLYNGLVDLSFWRKVLEKNYLSKRMWEKLIKYYSLSKDIGTSEEILRCIEDFVERAKDQNENIHLSKWEEIGTNPLDLYSSK